MNKKAEFNQEHVWRFTHRKREIFSSKMLIVANTREGFDIKNKKSFLFLAYIFYLVSLIYGLLMEIQGLRIIGKKPGDQYT